MKRLVLVLLLCLVSALLVAQDWKALSVPDAGLSVSMPSPWQSSSRTDSDQGFSVLTKTWLGHPTGGNYIVAVSYLPKKAPADFAKNMIAGIKHGFLTSAKATADSDKAQAYSGVSGRLITFSVASGPKGALWIGAKAGKVFILTVVRQNGKYEADMAKMFGSVKIR